MNRLKTVLLLSAFIQIGTSVAQQKASRPNIITILIDDMGYSDLGCYGSEINTPNIDALAKSGMMMNNFFNDARCCPTRASLLTGQYQHKVGVGEFGTSLTNNGVTIAEALKKAGYNTAMVGKWHLSEAVPMKNRKRHLQWLNREINPDTVFADVNTYPVNRGFDQFYGLIWGVVNYFNPFSLVEGTKAVISLPKDYYTTHAFTDKAIEYVNGYKNDKKPFFMYLAFNASHWPVQAPAETIKKYEKSYLGGWDSLRRVRYEHLIEKGIINRKDYPYVKEEEEAEKWAKLTPSERLNYSKRMSAHAATIDEVDKGVGRLVAQLKKNGQFKNTVIFFMSDNGASPELPKAPGYDRPSALSDGTPLQYGMVDYDKIGSAVSYTAISSGWANAANSPYRYWKKDSYNGGAKTPMFMTGPGIKQGMNYSLAHVMDIMPTCLELAGANQPEMNKGVKTTPIDGHSLLPEMRGETVTSYKDLFFEHQGGRALISGDFKIVALDKGQWELFNIKHDATERDNLASTQPDKLIEMVKKWEEWAKSLGIDVNAEKIKLK